MSESGLLRDRLQDDMKTAMRAKDKPRLATIRLVLAAIKQKEIDEQITLDDAQVLAVLSKMLKQRKDSVEQYLAANRQDLADVETFEIDVIKAYLPEALSDEKIAHIIDDAITQTAAHSMQDMGKVMGLVKPQIQGRADMAQVSRLVKERLASSST